jgi:hypothetical protein
MPTDSPPDSQWQRFLKNLGCWQGSFTQLSATGDIVSDVTTEVTFTPSDDGKAIRQEIHRHPVGESPQTRVLEYSSLNRATLFFEDGAFSQGALHWGPYSTFGAELGFIHGDRRLRIVQLFGKDNHLQQLTFIRERLKDSDTRDRPELTLEDLIGTWQGEATTLYADLRPEHKQKSQLVLERVGDRQVRQTITLPEQNIVVSSLGSLEGGALEGRAIGFNEGPQPMRVLLLPDGASATFPPTIIPRQPLFLETGWLLSANHRQRMIRSYDASGAWDTLTLVNEYKV